jgi:hypothetical protein
MMNCAWIGGSTRGRRPLVPAGWTQFIDNQILPVGMSK